MARHNRNNLIAVGYMIGLMVLGTGAVDVTEALDSRTSFTRMQADSGTRVVTDNPAGRQVTEVPCGPKAQLANPSAAEAVTTSVTTRGTTTRNRRSFRFLGARKRLINR